MSIVSCSTLHDLVGKSITNHQCYTITFNCPNGQVVAKVKTIGEEWNHIPVSVDKDFSFRDRTLTPIEVNFDKTSKRVIIGLKGGELAKDLQHLLSKSNLEINTEIILTLPKGKFYSVRTEDCRHVFQEGGNAVKAKFIFMDILQDGVAYKQIFSTLLASLGFEDDSLYKKEINEGKLMKTLKRTFTGHQDCINDMDVIKQFYTQCTEINLYISLDGAYSDIKLMKDGKVLVGSQMTKYTYGLARIITGILPLLLQIFWKKKS